MDVQNDTVPEPVIPLACTSNSTWPTFWGPKIFCTYDPQETHRIIGGLDDGNAYNGIAETFKCNLQSADPITFEAKFVCEIEPEFVNSTIRNFVNGITECVYNTSVVISSVLNPVSEVSLVLPKRYDDTLDTALSVSNISSNCNVYQVLNCSSVNENSFYENAIDVLNSSLMEPLKCYLSYKYFNDPDSIINSPNDSDLNYVIPYSFDWSFLFVIIFIIAGGVGNILVCLAVALDRNLQNVTNYFLFSLAIADLLVSLFVMPLGAIPAFLGYWPFGRVWCNIYVTCDVLACSSSILHMSFISLSRYIGIRNPLGSRNHATTRVVGLKIGFVWVLAMIISSSITVLGIMNISNIMTNEHTCQINNRGFFVIGSLLAFYVPMLVMVATYSLTVRLLSKKAKFAIQHPEGEIFRRFAVKPLNQQQLQDNPICSTSTSFQNASALESGRLTCKRRTSMVQSQSQQSIWRTPAVHSISERNSPIHYSKSHPHLNFTNGSTRVSSRSLKTSDQCTQTPRNISRETRRYKLKTLKFNFNNVTPPNLNINLRFLNTRNKRSSLSANAVATEQKASKVLGLVFFTFVFCWSPFFILNIIFVVLPDYNVSKNVVNICLWLGYFSSTINPIIYTIFNKTFRAAFIRLLKCNCNRSGRPSRYRSVNEGRSAASLCAPSALPLAISLQGAPLLTPSTVNATPMSDFRGSYTITDDEC